MKYRIVNSSSQGNCTILEHKIAIDMGVSYTKLGKDLSLIKLVLLTHRHSDHFRKVTLSKLAFNHPTIKFVCMDYLVPELLDYVPKRNIFVIEPNKKYDLGLCKISAFPLKHDVPNVGWKVEINGERCIYATDTASLEGVVAKGYDLYLIEGNYDMTEALNRLKEKEAVGEFAYERRAIQNHLSRQQCEEWLTQNMTDKGEFVCMHQHVNHEKQEV